MTKKHDSKGEGPKRQVFLEFFPIGHSIKVVAIDEETGIEVSIVGSRSASKADLERLAVRKLVRRIENLSGS